MNDTRLERNIRRAQSDLDGYIDQLIAQLEELEILSDQKDKEIDELKEKLSNTEPI